jgi:uncharacterized protein (TIGR03083 family)
VHECGDERRWARPTRCTEWSVRDLLGHLAMLENYNRAGLDLTVNELFARARADGANGLDGFNAWGVRLRADRTAADVLAEWRTANAVALACLASGGAPRCELCATSVRIGV